MNYGIKNTLEEGPDGYFKSNTTVLDEIADNVENWLECSPGERLMRPTFGSGFRRLLFEPANSEYKGKLEEAIRGGLQRHFPYLQVERVSIEQTTASLGQKMNIRLNLLYQGQQINIAQELSANG